MDFEIKIDYIAAIAIVIGNYLGWDSPKLLQKFLCLFFIDKLPLHLVFFLFIGIIFFKKPFLVE